MNFFLDFFRTFAYMPHKKVHENMLKQNLINQAVYFFIYFFSFKGFKVCLKVS